MKENYFLYNGEKKRSFRLPPEWTVREHTRFPEDLPAIPVSDLVKDALARPTGSITLSEMADSDMTVAIIVDDPARATPVDRMLPPVLDELLKAGVSKNHITIVVALGTHRPASEKDLQIKLGKGILQKYRVVQHNCHAKNLVPIGNLLTGLRCPLIPLWPGPGSKSAWEASFPIP